MWRRLIYLIPFILVLGLVLTSAANAADPNLVGWWKLDGDANDSSGYGLNGTTYGGPTYVAGPTYGANLQFYAGNSAISLGGNTAQQYVDLPIGNLISKLTDCSLTIWVNYRQTGGGNRWQRIFDFGTSTTNYMCLRPRRSSSPPTHFEITTGGVTQRVSWGPYTSAGTTIPTYTWLHIAVTIDDVNNIFRLYVNGVQRGQTTGADATLAPIDLGVTTMNWLGRSIDPAVEGVYLPGYLDDFRIYNRTLSVDEIKQAMGYPIASFPAPADGTVFPVGTTSVNLSWVKGAFAADVNGHHLYVGTNLDEVSGGASNTDNGLLSSTTYSLTGLETGPTYYWRVDEIEADGTTHTGDIWRFRIFPVGAWQPLPANNAVYVVPNATLHWAAGSGAVLGHNVYLGNNFDQVNNAAVGSTTAPFRKFFGPTSDPNWTPAKSAVTLGVNKTYYWRVDEVESQTLIHKGSIWSFTIVPNSPPITDPNLVGWWMLDGDAIDSGYGCDGTEIGGPTYDAGFLGSAIYLNNTDDPNPDNDIYVNLPIGSVISTLTNSTFAIWVNWTDAYTNQRFFSFSTTPANSMYLAPRVSASVPTHFQISSGGVTQMVGYGGNAAQQGSIIPINEWHHLAVTINADSDVFLLYLDGQQVGELTAATLTPSNLGVTTNNWLGRSEDSVAQRQFRGYLDDFRIYNKVLSVDEIRQLMVRLTAGVLSPRHRVIDVPDTPTLSWLAGEKANQHDVYFGSDQAAVAQATAATPGIYRGRQALDNTSYVPAEAPLVWGQTYYWRIDQIEADGVTVHKGNVWSFTVANFIVVENFEYYNDFDNRIFDVWADYAMNNTGMTVGHFDPPFAERTIVRSGSQAMYTRYDNDGTVNEGTSYQRSGTKYYSEAERQWQVPQDWTRNGVNTLRLWLRGIPASVGSFTAGPPIYRMTGDGADVGGTSDQFHYAYKQLSGVGSITAKVISCSTTDSSAKAGVMIREALTANSAHAMVAFNPSNQVELRRRTTMGDNTQATYSPSGITAPVWVRLSRTGNTFTAEYSTDGATWVTLGSELITMLPDVYIGLFVCSRNAARTCVAEFSDVTTAGTVTGQWQSQDIGIESNIAEPLYVVLEDSAGKSAVVKHPDPAATTLAVWTEWNIPLTPAEGGSDPVQGFALAGVNLQAIKKMTIGVGDRANTQPGGAGDLYIDDIGVHPAPPAQ